MTTRKAQKKIPSCLIVLLAIIVTVFLIIFFGICYLKEHKFYKSARDYASALSIFLFFMVLAFRFGIGALMNLVGKSDR